MPPVGQDHEGIDGGIAVRHKGRKVGRSHQPSRYSSDELIAGLRHEERHIISLDEAVDVGFAGKLAVPIVEQPG